MKYLVILSVVVTLGSVLALPASHRAQSDEAVQETLHEISRKHGQFIFGLGYVSYHSPLWVALKDLDDEELSSFVEELHSHHKPQNEDEQAEAVEDDQVEQEVDELSSIQYGEVVPGLGFVSYYSPMWDVIKDLSDDELAAFIKELHGYPFAQNQDNKASRLRRDTTHQFEHMAQFGHVHHDSHWSVVKFFNTEEFRKFFSHLHLPHHRPLHRPVHHHHQEVSQEAEEDNEFPKGEPADVNSPAEEVRSQNEDEQNSIEADSEADEEKRAQNDDDDNKDETSTELTEKGNRTQNEDEQNNDAAEEEVEEKVRDQNEDEENTKEVEDEIEEENRGQNEDAENKGEVVEKEISDQNEVEVDEGRAQNVDEENVEYKVEEGERQNENIEDKENSEEVEDEIDEKRHVQNDEEENVEESEDEVTETSA